MQQLLQIALLNQPHRGGLGMNSFRQVRVDCAVCGFAAPRNGVRSVDESFHTGSFGPAAISSIFNYASEYRLTKREAALVKLEAYVMFCCVKIINSSIFFKEKLLITQKCSIFNSML